MLRRRLFGCHKSNLQIWAIFGTKKLSFNDTNAPDKEASYQHRLMLSVTNCSLRLFKSRDSFQFMIHSSSSYWKNTIAEVHYRLRYACHRTLVGIHLPTFELDMIITWAKVPKSNCYYKFFR